MKARIAVALLVSLMGCRAVIGVDELVLVDGGTAEAGVDGGAGDSGSAKDANDGAANACATSSECFKCCKDGNRDQNRMLEDALRDQKCICGGATDREDCSDECDGGACQGVQPSGGGLGGGDRCGPCLDQRLHDPNKACQDAYAWCRQNRCGDVVECLMQCR